MEIRPPRFCRTIAPHALGQRLYSVNCLVRTSSTAHRASLLDLYGDGVLCVVQSFNVRTSFSWSRTVSVPPPKSPWRSCRAVVPGSLHLRSSCKAWKNVATRQATSSTSPSSTGLWTNASRAANTANAPSGSFHLAFKAANHSINVVRYCFNYCLSTS